MPVAKPDSQTYVLALLDDSLDDRVAAEEEFEVEELLMYVDEALPTGEPDHAYGIPAPCAPGLAAHGVGRDVEHEYAVAAHAVEEPTVEVDVADSPDVVVLQPPSQYAALDLQAAPVQADPD
jgi:hypothetical protein